MDGTEPAKSREDEFAVRLGWGAGGEEDPRDARSQAVEEPGAPDVPLLPGVSPDGFIIERTTAGGDRRELQQIRTMLADLRNDVTGLRRAVRASSEIQELALSIAELRAEVAELLEAAPLDEVRADLAALRKDVAQLPQTSLPLAVLEPILSELGGVRADLVAIKRRTALRAAQSTERTAEEAEQLAGLVAERLAALAPRRSRRS